LSRQRSKGHGDEDDDDEADWYVVRGFDRRAAAWVQFASATTWRGGRSADTITVTVITREPKRVSLVKPTGTTLRALLGPARDVTCCGLDECRWSESVYACLLELSGDVCKTAICNDAGCVCTS
jgi:hypothetical protein